MMEERFRKAFLILLVVAISVAFLAMVRMFLLTVLLAAIIAALARPLYLRFQRWLRGNGPLASAATIVLLLGLIMVPLVLLAGVVAREAIGIAGNVRPWIEARLQQPDLIDDALRHIPYVDRIEPIRAAIITRGAELVGDLGTWFANALSAATRGTVLFFFHLFILLYTLFFFLMDGPRMLESMMAFLPLAAEDKKRMVDRFTSVARATLKGTVLIGTIQGALSGLAFWVVGIDGAVFWTALMIVLSILPGIGAALVWVPAVVLLVAQGAIWQGIGVTLYCALLVGSVDNVMRPWLVGRDTQMHNLMILFSTLGGLVLFGVSGFIVGPILAALFVTVWEMFGIAFRDALQDRQAPPSAS
jgi:predicted PurR-regulated permease PerM